MNTSSKDDRDWASRWLAESQNRLSLARDVLNAYNRLSDRIESTDRENRHLRAENEQLRHRTKTLERECARLLEKERQLRAEVGRTQRAREEVAERPISSAARGSLPRRVHPIPRPFSLGALRIARRPIRSGAARPRGRRWPSCDRSAERSATRTWRPR